MTMPAPIYDDDGGLIDETKWTMPECEQRWRLDASRMRQEDGHGKRVRAVVEELQRIGVV